MYYLVGVTVVDGVEYLFCHFSSLGMAVMLFEIVAKCASVYIVHYYAVPYAFHFFHRQGAHYVCVRQLYGYLKFFV